MDIGHAERQYKCSKCRLTFTHLGNLVYHEKAAHDVVETKAPFKCNECNHIFLLEEALNYHQKTEHGYEIESFDCDKCNWKFFSKAASYVHKKMHHNSEDLEEGYFCSFCSEVCFSKKEIVKHHLDNHKLMKLPLFLCDNCDFSASRISETKEHLKTKHDIDVYKPFICNICDLKWDNAGSFLKHNQNHHVGYENRQKFVCDLCGEALLSGNALRRHKMIHSAGKEKNFVCDICGKAMTTQFYLVKHKRQQHVRGKDIKCEHCDRLFRRKDGLRRHIDSKHPDTSEKKFTCTICEKSFIFKISLCHHLYDIHKTSSQNYESDFETVKKKKKSIKCAYCEQQFERIHVRERHIDLIHPDTAEKNVTCTKCEKSFIFKSSLVEHLSNDHKIPQNTTSNESDFEPAKKKLKMGCSYCDRMFMDTKKLETHVEKIHSYSLEKDFVCSECGKEFVFCTSLKDHLKTHLKV